MVVNVVCGDKKSNSESQLRKVFPPQVIEKFIRVFFWYSYAFNFTFKYFTHLEFIIMHFMNN